MLFAAASLSATVVAQLDTGLPKRCPTNPFSSHLKDGQVELFESPRQSNTAHCGQEWQSFGFCCNRDQLIRFANSDQANITKSVESVLEMLRRNLNSFESATDHALQIRGKEFSVVCDKTDPVIKLLQENSTRELLNRLKVPIRRQNFSSELRSCWSKISSSRSNALCSVCSGRSDTFFSGGRIMMLEADCSNILDGCAPSFDSMVQIVELLAELSIRLEEVGDKTWEKLAVFLAQFKSLITTIKSLDIHISIQTFLDTTGAAKARTGADLCSKFLNIKGLSFIEKVEVVLSDLKFEKIQNLMKSALEKVSNQGRRILPTKKSQRLLSSNYFANPKFEAKTFMSPSKADALPVPKSLFEGDVQVVFMNIDSSYTSYFGARGTTVASHVAGRPFNITNLFP